MRKFFMLSVCLGVLAWALSVRPADASLTCNVTCASGATLRCCLSSGSCSSTAGGIDCNGTLMNCSDIDSYNDCRADCRWYRDDCFWSLCNGEKECIGTYCQPQYFDCLANCGPAPTTNIGC
jgi:hypothetical protein